MYTLGRWSSCENYTIFYECNDEKCRLCIPCKMHRGYAVQIKDRNTCLERVVTLTLDDPYAPTLQLLE